MSTFHSRWTEYLSWSRDRENFGPNCSFFFFSAPPFRDAAIPDEVSSLQQNLGQIPSRDCEDSLPGDSNIGHKVVDAVFVLPTEARY